MGREKIRGVALIVNNPRGEILILKEFKDKPHLGKYAGMFSIPMETLETQEDDISALIRLIEEELPGFGARIQLEPRSIGHYRIAEDAWARLYLASVPDCSLPDAVEDGEVGDYKWIVPTEALSLWLRQGAKDIIQDYITTLL